MNIIVFLIFFIIYGYDSNIAHIANMLCQLDLYILRIIILFLSTYIAMIFL